MEDNHGYDMADDMRFDDLMNSAGWPASTEQQFAYGQPQANPYTQYQASQMPYEHFDPSQQPSYPPAAYSNSPYTAQYQHARPSDVFGPNAAYDVDPSLQASYHAPDSSFSFAPSAIESATISPQSLQYGMPSNQSVHRGVSNVPFQPPANGIADNYNQRAQDQSAVYYSGAQNGTMQVNNANSVGYPVLPNDPQESESKQPAKKYVDPDPPPSAPRTQQAKPTSSQNPLRMIYPDVYASPNPSSRPRFEFAPFLSWEDQPLQITLGLKNTLPKYHPRKSRSGKELVPGFDLSRSASTPARPSTKKARPPKETKPSLSKLKAMSPGVKPLTDKINTLRDESNLTSIKSPSTPTETSSSEEESSTDEESEYDEDEDMPVMDISEVRGPNRPTEAAAAARWDAIGIIWKDPGSSPSADVVKDAIEKYGSFLTAIRVQLKNNSTKAEQAAGRAPEVEKLKNERKVLLESLFQIIDAANQLGYGAIVEHLGGHHKLVNGLTTTLIECNKAEDFVGKLPKAVFALLAKFQTMTDDLLKKLKFESIAKRWSKRGDEDTKKYIATILSNTVEAKEKATKAKKDADRAQEEKKMKEMIEQAKTRNAESPSSTLSNSTKRPHDGDGSNGKPAKKFASDNAGTPAALKTAPPKPMNKIGNNVGSASRVGNNLLGIASKPVAKPVSKKREPSPPPESKLGALLASIAKDPEPKKAPEAPPRPPETPEEKARRERKESRRHLRVKFKEGSELEEIRLFKHEQAEDEGRQDEMLRDAHDDRLEGMMHKKRVSETLDDDEDYQPAEPEGPYNEPVSIDFSVLDKLSRFGQNYTTRGGELTFVTPEQKIQQRREGLELMVIYTNPDDIPPSPKELTHPDMPGSTQREHQLKAPTEPWLVQRLQEIHQYGPERASKLFYARQEERMFNEIRGNQSRQPFQATSAPPSDVSSLLQQLGGPGQQPAKSQIPQAPKMDPDQLANLIRIVDTLKNKPYPPIEPPDWMVNPEQRAAWIASYERDRAAKEKREAEERMAQMQAAQYQAPVIFASQYQQQIPTPQMTYQPIPLPIHPADSQMQDINQQVQSLLASSYGVNENHAAPAQQYDYSNWASQQSAEQNQGHGNHNQQSRWEGNWNHENSNPNPQSDRGRGKSNSKGKKHKSESKPPNDSIFDENGEYKGKKKPCRFYSIGQCQKGSKCTYLHTD